MATITITVDDDVMERTDKDGAVIIQRPGTDSYAKVVQRPGDEATTVYILVDDGSTEPEGYVLQWAFTERQNAIAFAKLFVNE